MSPFANRSPRRGSMLSSETILKRGALTLVLLVVVLAVFATKFTSLDVNGADYAQIARNVATGHGYTTSVLSPLSLAVVPRTENHPELTRPPAYVTVLALAMIVGGASDKTVVVVSLIFFLLSALALYFVARRCFGSRVALWSALLYSLSVPVLRQAISGLDTTFLCFLVTLLFGVLLWNYRAPHPGDEDEGDEPSSYGMAIPIAAGVLLGLCYMTSYDTLVLLPVVLYFLWRSDRPQFKRHLVLTLVPFLVLVLPWIIRCSIAAGGPFISLHGYELAMFTDQYPGQTLFGRFADIPHKPWLMLITHWSDMVKKIGQGFGGLYTDAAQFAGPYLMPFFIVGLFLSGPRRRWTLLHGCLGLVILLQVIVLCFYQSLGRLLLPYAPLVAAVAVYWFVTLVEEWNEALVDRRRSRHRPSKSRDWLAYLGLMVAGGIPLVLFMFLSGASQPPPVIDTMKQLATMPYPYVATDLPWLAAWYGEKQALALPFRDLDWKAMEQVGLTPPAVYLSSALVGPPPYERYASWQFHGMTSLPNWHGDGLLLAKTAATSGGPPAVSATPGAPRPPAAP